MRHTNPRNKKNFAELCEVVLFMLAAFPGTGEVDSTFAALQAMNSHMCAGVGIDVLTPCMKVVLDGPPLSEFVHFARPGCNQTYQPTALSGRSQNWYLFLFGGRRKFSHDMSDIVVVNTKKPEGQHNVGSMAETLKDLALDEVEESQSQMRTDAQKTIIHDCMHKDLENKNRRLQQDAEPRLQQDAGPQCTDF